MTMFKTDRKSFSLIEMLVVIAIIGILFMILMPVIRDIKERGRMVRCKSNLKELHTAAMTYAVNYGGCLPYSISGESQTEIETGRKWRWGQNALGWVDWVSYQPHDETTANQSRPGTTWWWYTNAYLSIVNGSLFQYSGSNGKIYVCPTFNQVSTLKTLSPTLWPLIFPGESSWGNTNDQVGGTGVVYRCYLMNSLASGGRLEYMQASRTLLFAEGALTNFFVNAQGQSIRVAERGLNCTDVDAGVGVDARSWAWDGELWGTNVPSQVYPYETIGFHHGGKGNLIFVDGHSEVVDYNKATDLFKMTNRWLYSICSGMQ